MSHSSKDKPFVDWLYSKLRSADLTVWYDKYEILVGDSIVKRIDEGLNGSELLIAVISKGSAKSNWVEAELEPKILQQIEGQNIAVLPVVLDKTDPGEMSSFLKGKKWIRFPRQGSEEKFRELVESIEGHLVRRGLLKNRRIFSVGRPTVQNPFGLRGGIEPERFIVPERLIREITEDLVKKQSISIVGARMMGKTSLLKFLASPRCRAYYRESGQVPELQFVYFDFQEYSRKSRNALLPELAHAMSDALSDKERFQGQTHAEALNWIKQTVGRRRTGDRLWILLFDEFDRVVELRGIDKPFFDELRSLPQHYNICLVIASRQQVSDLPLPQSVGTSPFFNFLKEHFLAVWDEPVARSLMFKPRGKKLKLFAADDFAFVTSLTANHPLLLQIGCYHLFNARRTAGKKVIDYDHLCDGYMQEAESIYRYYWNSEISNSERSWLQDCQQALKRKDVHALQALAKDTAKRKNSTIRIKLTKLGLVSPGASPIALPTGFQSFLTKF